jgi:hypothetical protein
MITNTTIPARLALLCDPGSSAKGVGPDAIEALLSTWLKTPIALGHHEDGMPYLIGVEGQFLSLSHTRGITAIALADVPIGLCTAQIAIKPSDLRAELKILGSQERARLASFPSEQQAVILATLQAKTLALYSLLAGHPLASSPPAEPGDADVHWQFRPLVAIDWRPWLSLAAPSRVPAGLRLGAPTASLAQVAAKDASCVAFDTPNGPLAMALHWMPAL